MSDDSRPVAVRLVEWTEPLAPLLTVEPYWGVRVVVMRKGIPVGSIDLPNRFRTVGEAQLKEAIVKGVEARLLEHGPSEVDEPLPPGVSVSIVVPTYDRPESLRKCLRSLQDLESPREIQIIVVDNHPESGLTAPVAAEFSRVMLVREPRQGSSYARNAGIASSRGAIVAFTDDDLIVPANWLENLLAPFGRSDVMAVTGSVLPLALDTPAQQRFDRYSRRETERAWTRFEMRGDYLAGTRHALPVWKLGDTSNAAVRACVFRQAEVGFMEEMLGAGMPSGGSEDKYLLYKILRAGYTAVYQPAAWAMHEHRRDLPALRRQIFSYSKSIVVYHLIAMTRDRDRRCLLVLMFYLPAYQLKQVYLAVRGGLAYPISLLFVEIAGYLAGPWGWWRSFRRVRRNERRSAGEVKETQAAGGRKPGEKRHAITGLSMPPDR